MLHFSFTIRNIIDMGRYVYLRMNLHDKIHEVVVKKLFESHFLSYFQQRVNEGGERQWEAICSSDASVSMEIQNDSESCEHIVKTSRNGVGGRLPKNAISKEIDNKERVAILDFGAQYGKVRISLELF